MQENETLNENVPCEDETKKFLVNCPSCGKSLLLPDKNVAFVCPQCYKLVGLKKQCRRIVEETPIDAPVEDAIEVAASVCEPIAAETPVEGTLAMNMPVASVDETPVVKKSTAKETNKKKISKSNKADLIFYCVFLAWPVLQFCIFYIGVNINSILMSFKEITVGPAPEYKWTIDPFTWKQYSKVMNWLTGPDFKSMIWVSLKSFFIGTPISMSLGLLFAYYIFKKLPFWGGFRVVLFLPQILSSVVVALIFRNFFSECIPLMFPGTGNLLDPVTGHPYAMLMFYNIWIGFGTSVLMYSNKMSSISDEIIESAHLDGATGLKEFWYIVLPLTYPTISVFLITGVAQICVNQFNVHQMFQGSADPSLRGIGYWFFVEVAGKFKDLQSVNGAAELPFYAAIGVVLTLITVPVALTVRWVLENYGPSEE